MKLVLTCEHAFPYIPEKYQKLFYDEPEILKTHEAYDPGSFDLFKALKSLANFSKYQSIGRLLIETNRSEHHPLLFSRYSREISNQDKKSILQTFYTSYRDEVKSKIQEYINEGNTVIHLSVHSFTPVLNSKERNCDIGLLYDPFRAVEKEFCKNWKTEILKQNPELKIRFNYPYLGKADGFTTSLRKVFPKNYLGIELEVNQKWASDDLMNKDLKKNIFESLQDIISKKPQN
ncbi:N-formylglutamate amidohydrolase [Christiangramia sediminis]|uniref:N-formylglutamate amidohydrolase n=1 Tax=Christiangramia sediminis TaxID=2881336 RepID=A0A9X1LGV5_9FLAO|nr:N-formylglutamate amidohydrolase [Christiangramia sediminis]MCB7480107.1 N-formylglutamate amidohydrolase [Christiangramia sediminis]